MEDRNIKWKMKKIEREEEEWKLRFHMVRHFGLRQQEET